MQHSKLTETILGTLQQSFSLSQQSDPGPAALYGTKSPRHLPAPVA